MGFFKKLVDILFGTQKEYAVKDLGIFHSKVCDWWQNEHYNWWSTIQLPLYSTETVIWIEGMLKLLCHSIFWIYRYC